MVAAFRRRQGLTLLEVTLACGLFAMLAAIASMADVTGMRLWSSALGRAATVDRGRTALERMLADVRRSDSVSEYNDTPGTLVCSTGETRTCYYLYNRNDRWPNPRYDRATYQLRVADVPDGELTYGDGTPIADGVRPPSGGTTFQTGDIVRVALVLDSDGAAVVCRGAAVPRNAP